MSGSLNFFGKEVGNIQSQNIRGHQFYVLTKEMPKREDVISHYWYELFK